MQVPMKQLKGLTVGFGNLAIATVKQLGISISITRALEGQEHSCRHSLYRA